MGYLAHSAGKQIAVVYGVVEEPLYEAEALHAARARDVGSGTRAGVQVGASQYMLIVDERYGEIGFDGCLDLLFKLVEVERGHFLVKRKHEAVLYVAMTAAVAILLAHEKFAEVLGGVRHSSIYDRL